MFVLAACGNNSEKEQSKSETKGSKETVKIENNYKMRGEKKDGSDAKKLKKRLKYQRILKRSCVRLWRIRCNERNGLIRQSKSIT